MSKRRRNKGIVKVDVGSNGYSIKTTSFQKKIPKKQSIQEEEDSSESMQQTEILISFNLQIDSLILHPQSSVDLDYLNGWGAFKRSYKSRYRASLWRLIVRGERERGGEGEGLIRA